MNILGVQKTLSRRVGSWDVYLWTFKDDISPPYSYDARMEGSLLITHWKKRAGHEFGVEKLVGPEEWRNWTPLDIERVAAEMEKELQADITQGRTWTREQTEETLAALADSQRDASTAPWYADALDAYEDLIAVCELALEASGAFDHAEHCPGDLTTEDDFDLKGCHYYAEHEAVRLLNLLRGRSED